MFNMNVMQLNANDESCKITRWYFKEGDRVAIGDMLLSIETSKASEDIDCTVPGILHIAANEGDEVRIGASMGYIFESEAEKTNFFATQQKNDENLSINITRLAQELMDQTGITEKQVLELGKKVILKSDIEKLIGEKSSDEPKNTIQISKHQQLVSKVVSRSHTEIPAASLLMKVYFDNASLKIQHFNNSDSQQIGITELIIRIIANNFSQFPFFFGKIQNDSNFTPALEPNIGVTMDMGKGLFIPVIKSTHLNSIQNIADMLMDYKIKAMRNNFKEEDFLDGNITITLNTDKDIVAVTPIILHGQTAIVSINAVLNELFKTENGAIETRNYFHIGLTYDHRVINGYNAVQFLKNLKEYIETDKINELFLQLETSKS